MGELETKKEFIIPPPEYPKLAEAKCPKYKTMIRAQQKEAIETLEKKKKRLKTSSRDCPSPKQRK